MDSPVSVDLSVHAPQVGIITINNPPVNAMSVGVPEAILDGLSGLNGNNNVSAILICAGGKGLLAGADIKQQGKPWPQGQANLIDLIAVLDKNQKAVGILLRHSALGGGLEIAMGCHFRIAQTNTRLGQPEVKIGIPPGAGGTQRLPRLVGAERALDMILSGDPISAERAMQAGLIDHIVSGQDSMSQAVRYLSEKINMGDKPPRTGDLEVFLSDPGLFSSARGRVSRRFKGQVAPMACIDCVEAATKLPFEEGLAYERSRFLECVVAEEAVSLRHVFFAERQSGKIPGIKVNTMPRVIRQAAVIGAGTMGTGIATCFANSKIPVTLIEQRPESLEQGMKRLSDSIQRQVQRGHISIAESDQRVGLVTPSTEVKRVANADVVIEAVYEDMAVKQTVFSELAGLTKPDAVLATNTSYLNVDSIAAATDGRESDTVGLHFFSPAHIMKLVEVIRGEDTSDETLLTGLDLVRRLGKIPVVSGVCHGFIGNRMFSMYNREAEFLLQEGATCEQVDNALEAFGMAMGSFRVRDLAGLDIGWANRKATEHLRNPAKRYSRVGDVICESGWYGQKTRKGFYLYQDGERLPNPDLQTIIDSTGVDACITSGVVNDQVIIERCLYALVNEGAKILEEGIAMRASDIDLVFIYGYGFPRWRGGPMHWADYVGLPKILEKIEQFSGKHDFWEPSKLLRKLVSQNQTFAQWDAWSGQ